MDMTEKSWQIMRVNDRSMLWHYREKLGLTQQQVADRAKIQLRQYQRFESEERSISSSSFNIACRVIEALELDPTKYFHGEYVWDDDEKFSLGELLEADKEK